MLFMPLAAIVEIRRLFWCKVRQRRTVGVQSGVLNARGKTDADELRRVREDPANDILPNVEAFQGRSAGAISYDRNQSAEWDPT